MFFMTRLLYIHINIFSFYIQKLNFQICHFCGKNVQDLQDCISLFHNFQRSSVDVFDNIKEKNVPLINTDSFNESPEPSSGT